MTSMSPAALPPIQPALTATDRQHPLFPLYESHRSFCSNNLLEAQAFADWLYQYNRNLESNAAVNDPRYPEFLTWMRENKGGARRCPINNIFPHNFYFWCNGGRW